MDNVAIVVVTYNRKNLLAECIDALLSQTYEKFDLLIFDNASTDGTEEVVKNFQDKRIRYNNTGANLGGAGGFAFGMNYALKENKYKYIWLMDDDTIPNKYALESLCAKANKMNDEFSFLASVVKWTDGNACLMNVQSPSPDAIKNMYAIDLKLIEIRKSSFVSCFINAYCATEVGLPIKEFFIYGDDSEYTQRLAKVKKGYLDLDSVVTHKMGSNLQIGLDCCPEDRIDRYFYGRRNGVYIARKGSVKDKARFIWRSLKLLVSIFKKAPSKKGKRLYIFVRGTFAGLVFNPPIIKEFK